MTVAPSGFFDGQTAETVTDSAITLVGTAFEYGGFTFPQRVHPDGGAYIGPNFGFTFIPEPRAWSLMLFGGAAVAACCHRRRAQQAPCSRTPRRTSHYISDASGAGVADVRRQASHCTAYCRSAAHGTNRFA
jgi:hypothetical protein